MNYTININNHSFLRNLDFDNEYKDKDLDISNENIYNEPFFIVFIIYFMVFSVIFIYYHSRKVRSILEQFD
jgi:hypothetical protein